MNERSGRRPVDDRPDVSEPDESHDRAVEHEPLLVGQDVFNTPFRLFGKRRGVKRKEEVESDE